MRPGDALASIARDLGVKLADLLALNDLTISSTIHPGRILTVPVGQSVVPATTSPAAPSSPGGCCHCPDKPLHREPGDALFLIARRHDLTLAALLAANSFTSTTTIVPGQVIRIPATAVVPAPAAAPTSGPTKSTSAAIDTLVTYLREQVGKPYKFFTAGPDTSDCSGLVVAGYRQIGVTLPHQSRMQATIGTAVDLRNESNQGR